MRIYDFYSYKENGELKFKLPEEFKYEEEYAISRLVIEWVSGCINERMFGIVEFDWVGDGKNRKQIFAFTKTEKTTITDIHVSHPTFHYLGFKFNHPQCEDKNVFAIKHMFKDSPIRGIKNAYIQLFVK